MGTKRWDECTDVCKTTVLNFLLTETIIKTVSGKLCTRSPFISHLPTITRPSPSHHPAITRPSPVTRHQDSPAWLTATEFADSPEVVEAKMEVLARLLLASRSTVIYTGAGVSTASGVRQVRSA